MERPPAINMNYTPDLSFPYQSNSQGNRNVMDDVDDDNT